MDKQKSPSPAPPTPSKPMETQEEMIRTVEEVNNPALKGEA